MNTKPATSGFPFGGNVLENLEMMGKAWSAGLAQMPGFATPASIAQSIPSMMVPTLDVNELDKRITDLRAVEQWLALNANMLRASIQALEVQRNTIATLQTIGATMMAQPSKPAPAPASAFAPAPAPAADTTPPKRSKRPTQSESEQPALADMPLNPAAWWANLQDQFSRIATAAAGDTQGAKAGSKETASKDDAAKDRAKEDNRPAARKPPTRRTS